MIPEFQQDGYLPPGIHWANWSEFSQRFGTTPHRQNLVKGLHKALICLRKAGCRTVYIGGSFVTDKEVPNDYDGCWDISGVNPQLLDQVLLTFDNNRAAQKAKYLGELLPAGWSEQGTGKTLLEFFQVDKTTGNPKGIVGIDLGSAQL